MRAQPFRNAVESLQQYVQPIFGYALNRTGHRQDAEDLAQEILLQCMKSLSAGADVRQWDSYVWTIARYTWIKWLQRRKNPLNETNGLPELAADSRDEPLTRLLDSDAFRLLRREIAYLSGLQRRIVIMHYYEGLKQTDIAQILRLPVGTIKWHLFEAKRELRKGMDHMRTKGELSFNPVRFDGMGHNGQPGALGETAHFLRSTMAQNIVYAAYHTPLTVNELAEELGTPPPFVEDEVRYLAEYGFLSEIGTGKYQTNMILWNTTPEQFAETHRLYQECAAKIAGTHFDALMDVRKQVDDSGVYYPNNDYNFLLWTLLPKNVQEQGMAAKVFTLDGDRALIPRKDGGKYIAYATLEWKQSVQQVKEDLRYLETCGPMIRRRGGELGVWQMNTFWSDRNGWKQLHYEDAMKCQSYWNGDLSDEATHKEELAFLLSKQYLLRTDKGYTFNAVWVDSGETRDKLRGAVPDLSGEYKPLVTRLYERLYEITMRNKPKHIEPQIDYMTKSHASGHGLVPYILKDLLDQGKLQAPQPDQRKTVTTLMGIIR